MDLLDIDEYAGQNCTHNGVTRVAGEKWGSHCLKYHCVRGNVKIMREACDFQGHCINVGSVWNKHCIKRTCVVKDGKYHVRVLEAGCQGKGHHCHKLGTKWHEKHHGKCQVRKCVKVQKAFVSKKLNEEC